MRLDRFLLPVVCLAATAVAGQEHAPRSAGTQPASSSRPSDAPLKGPVYLTLRQNEDFSYLNGPPGSFRPDPFDAIKNICLTEDWRLRLGGEVKLRWESETNRNFGSRDPTQDASLNQRYMAHADLKYRNLFRLFVEGLDAEVADRELQQIPGNANRADVNQAFADVSFLGPDVPLSLRAGRQVLSYGRERLVGGLDWIDTPRRYDGATLLYKGQTWDVDVFWVKPILFRLDPYNTTLDPPIDEDLDRVLDHYREEQQFYGMYSTYKGIPRHALDAYFLGLHDKGTFVNVNGHPGDLSLYTVGARFGGVTGALDYDVEGAGQWGAFAGDDVHAWMQAVDLGYTLKEVKWTPRLGAGFDFASGDDSPRDRDVQTFNQLFPTGHAFLGMIDLVARQNILAPNVSISFKPHPSITAQIQYFHFWADSNLDALYNAAGVPIRRNVSGSSGNDIGDELDALVKWQIDPHSSLHAGWAHFWPNNFINSSGRSQDADFCYVQYAFKF